MWKPTLCREVWNFTNSGTWFVAGELPKQLHPDCVELRWWRTANRLFWCGHMRKDGSEDRQICIGDFLCWASGPWFHAIYQICFCRRKTGKGRVVAPCDTRWCQLWTSDDVILVEARRPSRDGAGEYAGRTGVRGQLRTPALTTLHLHLHALGLDRYDAINFFYNNIEFQGDVTPLLRCASAGNFLATNGKNGEVANFGLLAVKPHRVLFEAALKLSKDLEQTLAQKGRSRNGSDRNECRADGFLHKALYKRSMMLNRRMLESGQNHSAFQIIDRCVWNYQSSSISPPEGAHAWVRKELDLKKSVIL